MRAPFITSLLATAWIVGAGCASAPQQQDPPAASRERDCADAGYDPLHIASSKPDTARDPEIESLLNQNADPRLAWVNRQMYLSLRSLDVELRSERRVAECEHPQSSETLEARTDGGAGTTGAVGGVVVPESGGGAATAAASPPGAIAMSSAATQSSIASGTTGTQGRSTFIRKSSLSPGGSGGNGATAPKISAGSDNDIVARRLRKAAEQETDPAVRAKLWKEYTDYRQGMAAR
jgi:hypothetical protein